MQIRVNKDTHRLISEMKEETGLPCVELVDRAIKYYLKSQEYIKLLPIDKVKELLQLERKIKQ